MKNILTFILFTLLAFNFFAQLESSLEFKKSVYKMEEVMTYIDRMYVDTVSMNDITESAIINMLEKLDPHSTYISKEDVDDANQQIDGSFFGVGIRFQILKDTLMVVATIPGGPSEKVGVQAGDKIIFIDNENIAGVGLKNSKVREKLMGPKDTEVIIEVMRRNSSKNLKFTITRDKIPVNSVDSYYMINKEIGYIKLNSFSRSTIEEVHLALSVLRGKGMKDLVFDLQGNGGGLLYAAQKVADEFLSGNKLIVYSEGKFQPRSDLKAELTGLWEKGRLVVLTDEYSASASEIVSGAIQDWDRGLIIGRRTFGKGLVQRPIELSDGSQIRLTIARYYTPSGRFIQKPYDDINDYKNDLSQRYLNGEFLHADSIHLVDSLKHSTLKSKRTVYNGGGIMPDIFVPLDTNGISDYFKLVVQGGHVNRYALTYTNENRELLKNKYKDFEQFKSDFKCDESFMNGFFNYIKKEQPDLEFDQEGYNESEKLLKLQLKSLIAQNLYGSNEFYELYNDTNEALQKAIEVLKDDSYNEMEVDK
jgi:carboxyl-terminal processing protease